MLENRQYWKGCLLVLIAVFAVYVAYICIPYSVNKHYEGAIYQQSKVTKRVPVMLSGKVYRGVFQTNKFIGTVQIDGITYSIETFRSTRSFAILRQSYHQPYPYVGEVTATNGQNLTTTAAIGMSGDFNSVLATTDEISRKYGKQAEFRAPITY